MLFGIGNKIRFKYTGTQGKVLQVLKDGMLIIQLEGGEEIPASPEHIERLDTFLDSSSVKAKLIINNKKENNISYQKPQKQFHLLKSQGILLAFEPVKKEQGTVYFYHLYLLNDTLYQSLYDIHIIIKNKIIKKIDGKIEPQSILKIMDFNADYLSDNPNFKVSCRQVSTEGMTSWLKKDIKIKPKSFFNKLKEAPLIHKKSYVFQLFEPFEEKEKKESLKRYTQKRNVITSPKNENYQEYSHVDIKKYAEFPIEKDLHIESLVSDASKLKENEILNVQLKALDEYLNKAIQLGVQKVFIIHGIGKGILKNKVAQQLTNNPFVKSFKNEHHPKYGGGATEIIFK